MSDQEIADILQSEIALSGEHSGPKLDDPGSSVPQAHYSQSGWDDMAGMVDVPAEAWNLAEEFGFSTSLPPISENSASYIQPISTGNVASIGPSIEYQEVRLAISTLQLRMDRFETLFENTRKEYGATSRMDSQG